MTLSEVSTLLPPPDGKEWKDQSFRGEAHFYLSHLCPPGGCTVMREPGGWTVYASAGNASAQFVLVTDEDLPAAYRRALTAVGLAPDAEKEALQAEVFALRRTLRECPTCDGDGIMDAVAGVTAPDGEEIIENVTCAECQGTGVSSWGEALDEAERLRLEVAVLRRRLTWASEVPTEPGVYVVGRGVKPYDGAIMFRRWDEDEGKMERPWVDAFGLPWTDEQMKGRRFFALDNLKETP